MAALNAQEGGKDNPILFHVQSRKHQAESAKCEKRHRNRNNTVQEFPLVSHNRMKQRLHIHCRYVTKDRPDGWRRRKSVIKKMFHCE